MLERSKRFNVGDVVHTDTHAVYQNTQESLSRLKGVVMNNDDLWNIHVKLEDFIENVGFSEFELSHSVITKYKNELV